MPKITFHIISLFPEQVISAVSHSVIKKAIDDGLIEINSYNLREFAEGKHRITDEPPYGGGAGMVMKIEPIDKALESASSSFSGKAIKLLLDASGKKFTQTTAKCLAKYRDIVLVCGHYEGVDERVVGLVDEMVSLGDYVVTGGELPSAIIIDAVSRLIEGALGNSESIIEESHSSEGYLEYPQYTRPEEYKGMKVPDVLLSGHHGEIKKWREEQSKGQMRRVKGKR